MQIYDEFCPLLLNQFKSRESIHFETFDAALDEFYSKIESQRAEQQQRAKEDTATSKLNKIRSDQVWDHCSTFLKSFFIFVFSKNEKSWFQIFSFQFERYLVKITELSSSVIQPTSSFGCIISPVFNNSQESYFMKTDLFDFEKNELEACMCSYSSTSFFVNT